MILDAFLNGYVLAWLGYLASAAIGQLVFWRMVRRLPPHSLQLLLRAVLAAVLFTPCYSHSQTGWLVPAWLYGSYEMILGHSLEASKAFTNLSVAGAVMLAVWIVEVIRFRRRS